MALADLTEAEMAYIAGIVDGEGCIQAHYKRKLALRLEVGNTDRVLIDWLELKLGGRITTIPREHPRRTIFLWRLASLEAVPVLKALLPYLIVKKRQAELFIELADVSHRGLRGRPITEAEGARRLALVREISLEKRKVA
jgi:hypothetical protein